MPKTDRILLLFNTTGPATLDQDFSAELKTVDWETEANVIKALQELEYPFELLGVFDDISLIEEKIRKFQPTLLFNLVERFRGDTALDRDIASFLKLAGIPFTGSGPTGLTLCKNKGLSKQILSYHRIRVPDFVILPKGKKVNRPSRLKFPAFIKPLREEASLGIAQASFVENDTQFRERVAFIHESMEQDAIAEEYIEGRELYISVLGNTKLQVFPIREMKFNQVPEDEPKFASYKAKWDEQYRKRWGIRNQFAGPLPNGTQKRLEKLSRKIYHLLHIRGYARLDMRLKPDGDIVFIEANPNPMLSASEDFAESAKKAGIPYPELIHRIIRLGKQEEDL